MLQSKNSKANRSNNEKSIQPPGLFVRFKEKKERLGKSCIVFFCLSIFQVSPDSHANISKYRV